MRVDLFLFLKKYVESRQKAKVLIENRYVLIDGRIVMKPSENIDETADHEVNLLQTEKYVGRGGIKLEYVIDKFNIDVVNKYCIDIGASTGGFTDCLLQKGAAGVCAVDSGKGQLHKKLLDDIRVTSYDSMNARYISPASVGGKKFDAVVMDVSFISQTLIIPVVSELLKEDGIFLTLIKPQFEAGRSSLNKNGIVKNVRDRYNAVLKVVNCALRHNFILNGIVQSVIQGSDGNIEYFAFFTPDNVNNSSTPDKAISYSDKISRAETMIKNMLNP